MNENQDINRPKLKKIKRPINRTMPVGESNNIMQQGFKAPVINTQNQNNFQPREDSNIVHAQMLSSKELNEYLDTPSRLPDVSKKQDEYFPNYISEDEYYNKQETETPEWLNLKIFIIATAISLILGLIVGKLFFSQSAVVHNGLQGVVVNSEVPRGRARCGIAERSQGCVLYIMNPQRQEMSAKDFYDLASQMTGRQRFMIETGNMRYANSRIKPGEIVQLNIPPL